MSGDLGFAKVEVMGHQSHFGLVTTEVYGAAVFFRVDQPEIAEREETLLRPEWIDGRDEQAPTGSVVKRAAIPGVSVLLGAPSIFRITPCTEEACLAAIDLNRRAPFSVVSLPERRQIAGPLEPDDDEDEDTDDPPVMQMDARQLYDAYRDSFPGHLPWETLSADEARGWTELLESLKEE